MSAATKIFLVIALDIPAESVLGPEDAKEIARKLIASGVSLIAAVVIDSFGRLSF